MIVLIFSRRSVTSIFSKRPLTASDVIGRSALYVKIAQKIVVCDVVMTLLVTIWLTPRWNLLYLKLRLPEVGERRCDGVSMKMTFFPSMLRRVTGLNTR